MIRQTVGFVLVMAVVVGVSALFLALLSGKDDEWAALFVGTGLLGGLVGLTLGVLFLGVQLLLGKGW